MLYVPHPHHLEGGDPGVDGGGAGGLLGLAPGRPRVARAAQRGAASMVTWWCCSSFSNFIIGFSCCQIKSAAIGTRTDRVLQTNIRYWCSELHLSAQVCKNVKKVHFRPLSLHSRIWRTRLKPVVSVVMLDTVACLGTNTSWPGLSIEPPPAAMYWPLSSAWWGAGRGL